MTAADATLSRDDRLAYARTMIGVSRGALWTAAVVLLGCAVVGSYLGYSRAAAAPGGSADADAYDVTPLAAKKASPINDGPAPPPPVDEAYIRKIAHDEAETILHPPKKTPVVVAADDSTDDSSDDTTSGSNPPTPPPSTPAASAVPAPAAAKPPPPPTGLY